MKKKMDALTKAKLIYCAELFIFAIVFLVFCVLKWTGVMKFNSTRSTVFNWLTIFGGSWIIIDFFWAMFSKKRRPRISLIDKIIHLPAGLYLVTFDIYCFVNFANKPQDENVYRYGVAIVFTYLGLCYLFEAIYHFFYPVPGLLDAVEEVDEEPKNEDEHSLEEIVKEENKDEKE